MTTSTIYRLIWLGAVVIAMIAANHYETAAFVDGRYVPVGNDSFYHARRIIDAALGERGFYQFDNMIHMPEGSWLNWPWAYDYLIALGLSFALWLSPDTEPMAFLAHIPVFWLLVNAGLFVGIARQLGLGPTMTAIGSLGFAISPLTQSLHGLGVIDHHFIELTFNLAALLAGLRFFADERKADAAALGIILGIAPAFHNGLFVLQIPLLIALLLMWLQDSMPARDALRVLFVTLPISALVAAIPSNSLPAMKFEFWTLSWFHVYVAACSALVVAWISYRPRTAYNLTALVIGGLLLAVPLFSNLLIGTAFLGGDLILLQHIAEVESPFSWLADTGGARKLMVQYSALIVVAPVAALLLGINAFRHRTAANLYIAVAAIFGTFLMLTQYRLHPFGSWVFLLGSLMLVQDQRIRKQLPKASVAGLCLLLLMAANVWSLRYVFLFRHPPGYAIDYAATRTLFPAFAHACSTHSGAVLSYNNDGHYIRYHTDCSVMTNNFLLTPFHEQKIHEADRLLQMTPDQLLTEAPFIDYVFVRMYEIFERGPNGMRPRAIPDIAARNAPLFVALTFSNELPTEYQLVDEVRVEDARDFAYARVFRIVRN